MKSNTVTILLVIGGAAFIGFAIMRGGGHGAAPAGAPAPIADTAPEATGSDKAVVGEANDKQATLLAYIEETDAALGDVDAPVVLVEFGDYQCTFCAKFFFDTKPTLIEKYVDTGVLRYVFRDFPVNGRESQNAAEASECANEQGKFWEYHDKLYVERTGYNTGAFKKKNLITYAGEIGLDVAKFEECYEDGRYKDEVAKDMREGRALGVSGTPNFFINGQRIAGALPTESFVQAIEQLAAQAR